MANAVSMPKFQNFLKEICLAQCIFSLKREIMNFTVGQKLKQLKLTFCANKPTNIVLEYSIRCGIATLGGGVGFLRKVHLPNSRSNQKKIRSNQKS